MKITRIISYIFLLIIIILAITFAALNASPIRLNYYLGTTQISLSLLLVYVLGLGILLGLLTTIFPFLKLKQELRVLKRRLKKGAQEVASPPQENM